MWNHCHNFSTFAQIVNGDLMLGQRIEGVECFQESATGCRPTENDAKPPF